MMSKENNSTSKTVSEKGNQLLDPVIKEHFTNVLSTLSAFRQNVTGMQNQIRALEKAVKKQMKMLQKEAKKSKNKGNRKPSGFAVPSKISNELCEFMGKPTGTKVARTEVTKYIIDYIDKNGLKKSDNRKCINPDDKLSSLLNVSDKDELTYFNIQKYMNKHFVKE
jgi:chromatin remodeling complex protein RSC6